MDNKSRKGQLFIAITGAVGLSLMNPSHFHIEALALHNNETADLARNREFKMPVDIRQALAEIDRLVQNQTVDARYVDRNESPSLLKLAEGERPFPEGGQKQEGGNP